MKSIILLLFLLLWACGSSDILIGYDDNNSYNDNYNRTDNNDVKGYDVQDVIAIQIMQVEDIVQDKLLDSEFFNDDSVISAEHSLVETYVTVKDIDRLMLSLYPQRTPVQQSYVSLHDYAKFFVIQHTDLPDFTSENLYAITNDRYALWYYEDMTIDQIVTFLSQMFRVLEQQLSGMSLIFDVHELNVSGISMMHINVLYIGTQGERIFVHYLLIPYHNGVLHIQPFIRSGNYVSYRDNLDIGLRGKQETITAVQSGFIYQKDNVLRLLYPVLLEEFTFYPWAHILCNWGVCEHFEFKSIDFDMWAQGLLNNRNYVSGALFLDRKIVKEYEVQIQQGKIERRPYIINVSNAIIMEAFVNPSNTVVIHRQDISSIVKERKKQLEQHLIPYGIRYNVSSKIMTVEDFGEYMLDEQLLKINDNIYEYRLIGFPYSRVFLNTFRYLAFQHTFFIECYDVVIEIKSFTTSGNQIKFIDTSAYNYPPNLKSQDILQDVHKAMDSYSRSSYGMLVDLCHTVS
ncbi:MAG: hypothetical protein ACMXYC_05105 [Candidatus Woesearchaeota archaeon]